MLLLRSFILSRLGISLVQVWLQGYVVLTFTARIPWEISQEIWHCCWPTSSGFSFTLLLYLLWNLSVHKLHIEFHAREGELKGTTWPFIWGVHSGFSERFYKKLYT